MLNHSVITGLICSMPKRWRSPAGVFYIQFFLEHRSVQAEAGLNREVYCRLPIIAADQADGVERTALVKGAEITVTGFLVRRRDRHGDAELVLHATEIKIIHERGLRNERLSTS
jgi:primosomal replication protein N